MLFYSGLEKAMEHFTNTGGFLTVKSGAIVNTMTVSWGFVGFLWTKPHFITVVRPQRYTKELIDKSDSFTISIPYETMREELQLCGKKSGRDTDKSSIVKFAPAKAVDSPIVDGCDIYYECRIDYKDGMNKEAMNEFCRQFYKNDFHDFYFGEIVECYTKEGRN